MALQSGLKSELTWALNTLTLLSFKEKDDIRKDATPLAKIPGLLDALLQVVSLTLLNQIFLFQVRSHLCLNFHVLQIDDWRDISLPRVLVKTPRVRLLGASSAVTGFGHEYEALSKNDSAHPR